MTQFTEAKKAFAQSAWNQVLKVYGCTVRELNTDIFKRPVQDMKHVLEDVGYAYSQLSNFRFNKQSKTLKNEDDIMVARDNAVKSYTTLLDVDEKNMKGLHGMAYVYYKFVIDVSGQKNMSKVMDLSRLDNFKEAEKWYQKLLALDEMNMKGNYRLGKLYFTILNAWSPSFEAYLKEKHMSRRNVQNLARVHFCKALVAYAAMTPQYKAAYAKYFAKTKYNLGNLCLSLCYDNSHKVWKFFSLNPNQPVPGYMAYGYNKELEEALKQYFEVLNAYHIDVDNPLDASQFVKPKKEYDVSPKDVLYRLGCVYATQYKRQCFTYGRQRADMALAERGMYYLLVSLQYAWWTIKKGYNRNENYSYVSKKLVALCRLADMDMTSEMIEALRADIPHYIEEPKKVYTKVQHKEALA